MKSLKKVFGTLTLVMMAVLTLNVNADVVNVAEVDGTKYQDLATALTNADGKTIKLLADVGLSSTFSVAAAKNVTLDLNGHTLTGPTAGYAIENLGTLTIKDTGATKGEIACQATGSSCIANKNGATKMVLDGVHVKSKFIVVKNEKSELEIKDSTIEVLLDSTLRNSVGVESYGTATITNSTIVTPNVYSTWGSLMVLPNDDGTLSKTTIDGLKVTGNGGVIAVGATGKPTEKVELDIVGDGFTLPKGITIYSYEGAIISPDASNVDKTLSGLSSRQREAGVVIPSDYEGEVPEVKGVKFVNAKGTEVVYVTFNEVRYDVEKGQNWTNNKALIGAIVDAQAVMGKNLVRYVDEEGNTVDKNTAFTKNTAIRAVYELTVKIATKDGDVTLKVEEGTSLSDQTGSNKEKLDAIRANKFRRFETTDGKSFGSTTKITSNLDLKVVYYVTVTVDKSVYFIDEGTSLLDNADIFKGLKEVEGKTFEKFVTTKDGKDFSEETKINEDVELTMVFKTEEEEPPVVEEEVTPPPTLDNVISYVIALVVGLMVVGTASFILIKKNREN